MGENYLIHYGILGMKWGVRRYQNYDGTRTELGKRRERGGTYSSGNNGSSTYTSSEGSTHTISRSSGSSRSNKNKKMSSVNKVVSNTRDATSNAKNIIDVADKYKSKKSKKQYEQYVKTLSDKELQDTIRRLNMERSYISLTQGDTSRGKELANDILTVVGSLTGLVGAGLGIYLAVRN